MRGVGKESDRTEPFHSASRCFASLHGSFPPSLVHSVLGLRLSASHTSFTPAGSFTSLTHRPSGRDVRRGRREPVEAGYEVREVREVVHGSYHFPFRSVSVSLPSGHRDVTSLDVRNGK